MLEVNKIYFGDCLEVMKKIDDKSIDCIICDLPYGTIGHSWDVIIVFDKLWEQYERIIKNNSAIVLFGSQPFTSKLIMSNLKMFKYQWVWNKKLAGNGILAKIQPLKIHEDIIIFSKGKCNYFPEMVKKKYREKMVKGLNKNKFLLSASEVKPIKNDVYWPKSILKFGIGNLRIGRLHPTQKPVALLEYLIKTYTRENDLVLDNCMGSGSTIIAAINQKRNYIGIEKEKKYFDIAEKRIYDHTNDDLFRRVGL